ncbi:MAG: heat shock protein GrpE [Syntrophus sp. PtaU1.Bin208]|nr:MAG: heat shock protein GrpE [Syntrophus sp. PtaU1.Bin208]
MTQKGKKDQENIAPESIEESLYEEIKEESAADEETESLRAQLESKEKAVAENYNNYLRALADLENYKKRAAKEKSDLIKYGNENLLRDFLPILDSLDRALDAACNSDNMESFREGMTLVRNQFLCALEKYGVEPIDACGQDFDPNLHEAMLEVASDSHEESKVVDEYEKGYLLQGRLLRPSKVSVCKRKKK